MLHIDHIKFLTITFLTPKIEPHKTKNTTEKKQPPKTGQLSKLSKR